jgi:hypothetical protein
MIRNLCIIFLFLITVSLQEVWTQPVSRDNLLRREVSEFGQARITIKNPGARKINELSETVSVTAIRDDVVNITLSPHTVDWFILKNYDYTIVERSDNKSVITSENIKQAMEWDKYPTYTQYDSIMRSFVSFHYPLCLLDTIGTTTNGRLVLVLKISDNVSLDEDEPEVFYSSSIHGDETGGFILMLRLADYLLNNYNTNSRIRNLVNNLEIWINPLANPDGTYRSGNTISNPTRYNANGYDLNRNFPDPETQNTPVQKETLDMVKFMRDHNFIISANFHAGVEVVNYPWDRWPRLHADDSWFYGISRKYADTVHHYSPAWYMKYLENGVTNGYDWYKINGGRQDFITYELQGREVTIELDENYVTPATNLNSLWQYNWHSLLGYLENATFGIHGKVKDALKGTPVEAKIFIKGHDKDSSHVYSDIQTGSFVRLIAPGVWDLTFSADGYLEKKVGDVIVTEGQATEIIVEMDPLTNPVDTVNTPIPIIYPNPGREYIKVVLPYHQTGNVNVMIYNSLGIKLLDYNTVTYEDIPLVIDLKDFPGGVFSLIITNSATNIRNLSRFVIVPGN